MTFSKVNTNVFKLYKDTQILLYLRRFRDQIRVPRIEHRVPGIGENYHRVPRIRENRVLRIRESSPYRSIPGT